MNTPRNIIEDDMLGNCIDILEGAMRTIEGNGYKVTLVDCSPRLCPEGRTAEYAIVRSARVSYGLGLKSPQQDRGLVNYLLRHQHTSPFEFVSFTFRIECPIFVARHIMRHRTFSINEFSARYSEMTDRFYIPDEFMAQDAVNKQGSSTSDALNTPEQKAQLEDIYNDVYDKAYHSYRELLDRGVSRETARMVLPVGIATEFYANIDLNNLFKFLKLRDDIHTQLETRNVAHAMYQLAKQVAPDAFAAWDAYSKNSMVLTKNEIKAIAMNTVDLKNVDSAVSTNEVKEYHQKLANLSLSFDVNNQRE